MGERGQKALHNAWAAKSIPESSSLARNSAVSPGMARPDNTGHAGGKKQ